MKQTLVFYDGSCRMCVGLSGWLSRIDGQQQFRLVPYQHAEILAKYPGLSPEACAREIHVVSSSSQVLKGADAVLEIWRKSGHWSAWIAQIVRLVPFIWFARPCYRLVARVRNWF